MSDDGGEREDPDGDDEDEYESDRSFADLFTGLRRPLPFTPHPTQL